MPTDAIFLARCRTLHMQQAPTPSSVSSIAAVWTRQHRILHEEIISTGTQVPFIPQADTLYLNRPVNKSQWPHPFPARMVVGQVGDRSEDIGSPIPLDIQAGPLSLYEKVGHINMWQGRCFITLKWASSQDGFIAAVDDTGHGLPTPLTGSEVKALVHQWRAQHQAIMVGRRTAEIDNPSLNTRLAPGPSPTRLVWDRRNSLPKGLRLFTDGGQTLVMTQNVASTHGAVRFIQPPQWTDLKRLAEWWYQELGICNLFVEGGSFLLQQFLEQGCFDAVHRFVAPKELGQGVPEPNWEPHVALFPPKKVGQDLHYLGKSA